MDAPGPASRGAQRAGRPAAPDHQTVRDARQDAQRVLEVASVAGDVFATAAVAAGLEVPVAQVDAICDTLGQQHAFLEPAGLEEWPDGTLSGCYRFQHALYRQVLSERLGELQRMQVHRRIGERLAQSYGPQTPTIATQLALHFAHGRLSHRAVQYLHQAGEQAMHLKMYHEARRPSRGALRGEALAAHEPRRHAGKDPLGNNAEFVKHASDKA